MRARPVLGVLAFALGAASGLAGATDIPQAAVVLEVVVHGRAGQVPEAAPPRFVLLEDGQVFVGGSSDVLTTKLDARELKDFDKRIAEVRKHPALAGNVTIGPGDERRRVVLRKGGRPLDMTFVGDPARALPAMRGLADFVTALGAYAHPGLRPYMPANLALQAREGTLPGGCRSWTHAERVTDAVFAPKMVAAAGLDGWPRGASAASVCAGDKRYVVTLRPLLPGERP